MTKPSLSACAPRVSSDRLGQNRARPARVVRASTTLAFSSRASMVAGARQPQFRRRPARSRPWVRQVDEAAGSVETIRREIGMSRRCTAFGANAR